MGGAQLGDFAGGSILAERSVALASIVLLLMAELLLGGCSPVVEPLPPCIQAERLSPIHLAGFTATLPDGCWIKGDEEKDLVEWGQQRRPGPKAGSWRETVVARMEVPDQSNSGLAKVMKNLSTLDLELRQEALAQALSRNLAEEHERTSGDPIFVTHFMVFKDTVPAHLTQGCVQQSTWIDDRRVPFEVGRLYKICQEEYLCFHPGEPAKVISLYYSERRPVDYMKDELCRVRARSFFSSLVFD